MAARKIKNSWWVDFHFGGTRHRVRSPENSKNGACAYEAVLRQRLARGEPIGGGNRAADAKDGFADFSKEWFETHVRANNRSREQDNKEMILRLHLVPFFGDMRMGEIATAHVERLKVSLVAKGLTNKTVNNILFVLSKCLNDACEWNIIQKVPRFKPLKVPPQRFDYLDEGEMGRLLDAITEPQWYLMALCALRTGMRVGELFALDWSSVDFERRQIAVRHSVSKGCLCSTKSNKARFVPMADDLLAALARVRRKGGTVFPASGGGYLTHSMARKAMKRFCGLSGLRGIGWHVLRHSFASCLVSHGVSLRIVQELLGHADIKMTMRYSHLAPSTIRDAVKFLPSAETPRTEDFGQQAVNRPVNAEPLALPAKKNIVPIFCSTIAKTPAFADVNAN